MPGLLDKFVLTFYGGIKLIKSSAIQRKSDGKIWTGLRHCNAIHAAIEDGIARVTAEDFIQGFVTDDGKFVNRREAFKIALNCNQLINVQTSVPMLTSEDLW